MGRSRTSGRSSNGSGGSVFNSAKAIAAASNKKTKPSKAGKNVKNRDTEVQDDVYSYKPRLDKSAKRVKRAGDETRKNLKESDERKGGMDWDDEKLAVANELGVGNVKFRVGMDTDDEDEDVEQEDEDAVETAKGKRKGKAVKRGRDETGEDDDEEIDSDEAWGEGSESDEEEDGQDKASTSKSKMVSKSTGPKTLEIDLDEDASTSKSRRTKSNGQDDSEEEDENDDEIFMDLSEMLNDEPQEAAKASTSKKGRAKPPPTIDEEEEESDVDSEEEDGEDDEDEESILLESDIELDLGEDPSATKLTSFIDTLQRSSTSKRKNQGDEDEDDTGAGRRKKRLILKERTEAYPEGEWVALRDDRRPGKKSGGAKKIDIQDLLSTLPSEQSSQLLKSLKPLTSSSATATSVSAPLPTLHAEKLARTAAYQTTRKELDKWSETARVLRGTGPGFDSGSRGTAKGVVGNALGSGKTVRGRGKDGKKDEDEMAEDEEVDAEEREWGEMRLVLPLNTEGKGKGPTGEELVAKFKPSNQLENSINSILQISQAGGNKSNAAILAAEQEALAALSPADSAARLAELRRTRELMFRAERKAKRVAKIKSKTYRRIAKKTGRNKDGVIGGGEDGEDGLSLEQLGQLDKLDGGNRVDAAREEAEMLRARERATLRHAAGTSKWEKGLKRFAGGEGAGSGMGGMGEGDEELKLALRGKRDKEEELRRKIKGLGSGDEDEDESGDESVGDEDVDEIRLRAFDELASAEAKEEARAAEASKGKKSGILGMKFMKDAMERERRRADEEEDVFKKELERLEGSDEEDGDGEVDDAEGKGTAVADMVQGNQGRMVFAPSEKLREAAPALQTKKPKKDKPHTTKLTSNLSVDNPFKSASQPSRTVDPTPANPWLALRTNGGASKMSRKANEVIVGKDTAQSTKIANKADRQKSRTKEAIDAANEDAEVSIDPNEVLRLEESKGVTGAKAAKGAKGPVAELEGDLVAESDEEAEEGAQIIANRKGPAAFKQRDLVARAFADDNVVQEFEEEKRREIEADAPQDEDVTIPGWGSWGGRGVKKSKSAKKFIKHTPGIEVSQRKDFKLSHVIISEKKDKKIDKYLVKDLPYPYTNAAQYEMKMAQPVGPEFTTQMVHRNAIKPKVLVKPGVIVDPIEKPI